MSNAETKDVTRSAGVGRDECDTAPNQWCTNKDGKSWNVKKAEEEISFVKQFTPFYRKRIMNDTGVDIVLNRMYKDPEMRKAVKDAAKEMADVLEGRKNPTGCHINHGVSGDCVYSVFDNDVTSYKHLKTCDTKEEALAAKAELPTEFAPLALVEKCGDSFVLMLLDEEETARLREMECFGTFVGEFSTYEEAESELEGLEEGYIQELPADEWWMVVDREKKQSLFELTFPTERRALAFLYKAKMPPAWNRFIELRDARDKEAGN